MKIYHKNNEIINIVYDKDLFSCQNNTNSALEFTIDETVPDNKDICIDLVKNQNKKDINNLSKYYMEYDPVDGWTLMERDGWVEHVDTII